MSDYVDGELRPSQRARLERHALDCPECGPLRRGLLRVVSELRGLRGSTAPTKSVAPAVIFKLRARGEDESSQRERG